MGFSGLWVTVFGVGAGLLEMLGLGFGGCRDCGFRVWDLVFGRVGLGVHTFRFGFRV